MIFIHRIARVGVVKAVVGLLPFLRCKMICSSISGSAALYPSLSIVIGTNTDRFILLDYFIRRLMRFFLTVKELATNGHPFSIDDCTANIHCFGQRPCIIRASYDARMWPRTPSLSIYNKKCTWKAIWFCCCHCLKAIACLVESLQQQIKHLSYPTSNTTSRLVLGGSVGSKLSDARRLLERQRRRPLRRFGLFVRFSSFVAIHMLPVASRAICQQKGRRVLCLLFNGALFCHQFIL